MSPNNRFRRAVAAIVWHPVFDNTILVLIAISSVALAVDTPLLDPTSTFAQILKVLDIILTVLFGTEMVLKIIAFGFAFHKVQVADPSLALSLHDSHKLHATESIPEVRVERAGLCHCWYQCAESGS